MHSRRETAPSPLPVAAYQCFSGKVCGVRQPRHTRCQCAVAWMITKVSFEELSGGCTATLWVNSNTHKRSTQREEIKKLERLTDRRSSVHPGGRNRFGRQPQRSGKQPPPDRDPDTGVSKAAGTIPRPKRDWRRSPGVDQVIASLNYHAAALATTGERRVLWSAGRTRSPMPNAPVPPVLVSVRGLPHAAAPLAEAEVVLRL